MYNFPHQWQSSTGLSVHGVPLSGLVTTEAAIAATGETDSHRLAAYIKPRRLAAAIAAEREVLGLGPPNGFPTTAASPLVREWATYWDAAIAASPRAGCGSYYGPYPDPLMQARPIVDWRLPGIDERDTQVAWACARFCAGRPLQQDSDILPAHVHGRLLAAGIMVWD